MVHETFAGGIHGTLPTTQSEEAGETPGHGGGPETRRHGASMFNVKSTVNRPAVTQEATMLRCMMWLTSVYTHILSKLLLRLLLGELL